PFGDARPLDVEPHGRPHIFAELVDMPLAPRGLAEVPEALNRALGELAVQQGWLDAEAGIPTEIADGARSWLAEVRSAFEQSRAECVALLQRFHALGELCGRLFGEMDFSFLYDPERELFSVGYDVSGGRLDHYHYDLLASECRLASFVAIAKHDVPQKHWFRMGRGLSPGRRNRALISWSGTMFEYMMPLL